MYIELIRSIIQGRAANTPWTKKYISNQKHDSTPCHKRLSTLSLTKYLRFHLLHTRHTDAKHYYLLLNAIICYGTTKPINRMNTSGFQYKYYKCCTINTTNTRKNKRERRFLRVSHRRRRKTKRREKTYVYLHRVVQDTRSNLHGICISSAT